MRTRSILIVALLGMCLSGAKVAHAQASKTPAFVLLDTDLDTMRQAYARSGVAVSLGGASYDLRVSFSAMEATANPWLVLEGTSVKPIAARLADVESGSPRTTGADTPWKFISIERGAGVLDDNIVTDAGARLKYRGLLSALYEASPKFKPVAKPYAIWLAQNPPDRTDPDAETIFVLIPTARGYLLCMVPLKQFLFGKPEPVYVNSYDLTFEVSEFDPAARTGRFKIWVTRPSDLKCDHSNTDCGLPYYNLAERTASIIPAP